uniref:Glutaredoxin domain-containing protein n=1 Tax=Macrostomum lignano TaxID=282301 RepID=A0A1I8FKK9_9PLAT
AMNDSKVQVGIKKVPLHLQSAQNRLLIKGRPNRQRRRRTRCRVCTLRDGLIKQVGCGLMTPGGVRVIDAAGMLVMPGKFGLASSLYGIRSGRPAQPPVIDTDVACERDASMVDWFNRYRAWLTKKAAATYGLARGGAAVVRPEDRRRDGRPDLPQAVGALAQVHAEEWQRMEVEATVRALCIADAANCPLYVLPVTSPEAADAIACARRTTGQACFGEVSPAALACDDSVYQACTVCDLDLHPMYSRFSTLPTRRSTPLGASPRSRDQPPRCATRRPKAALAARLGGLNCGPAFAVCAQRSLRLQIRAASASAATDFRQNPARHQRRGGPAECRLGTCFVAVTSANAAKLFNIYPQKAPHRRWQAIADVIVTISAKAHHETSDFSVFDGFACHGVPEFVISGGRLAVDERQLRVTPGRRPFRLDAAVWHARLLRPGDRRERAKAASQLPVTRAAYDGPVVELKSDQCLRPNATGHRTHRAWTTSSAPPDPRRRPGIMQESSFQPVRRSFDDKRPSKSGHSHQPAARRGSSGSPLVACRAMDC